MNKKIQKKIVVWDLMGGGQNSVRCALKDAGILHKYEIYTFDIVQQSCNFKNIVLDVSQSDIVNVFQKLIDKKIIKKPDIIVSSSLCQSFSLAMQSISSLKDKTGNFFSGNPHRYWNYETKLVEGWPKNQNIVWNGFCGNSYPGGSIQVPKVIYELGDRCIQNTITLIRHFQPKYWYIENPERSLIWKYIQYNLKFDIGYSNVAHYSAYDVNFSRKPTCFLSNIKMDLKKIKNGQHSIKKINSSQYLLILSGACKDNYKDELKRKRSEIKLRKQFGDHITVSLSYKKNSMERSKIPPSLIVDIFEQFSFFKKIDNLIFSEEIKLTPLTEAPLKIDDLLKSKII